MKLQECSIFLFEKRSAEKLHKPKRKEVVTEILRASVKQLERFRHPKVWIRCRLISHSYIYFIVITGAAQILQILHPVEECADTIAFATEPVFASLANILAFQVSVCLSARVCVVKRKYILIWIFVSNGNARERASWFMACLMSHNQHIYHIINLWKQWRVHLYLYNIYIKGIGWSEYSAGAAQHRCLHGDHHPNHQPTPSACSRIQFSRRWAQVRHFAGKCEM